MMTVLGIDCTTKSTGVGISRGKEILGEINVELGREQSSKLPLLVSDLLLAAKITLSDIDLIAAAKGPGYYTGIRTGIAYAAALAESLAIRVVPVSAMELFVYDMRHEQTPLIPVLKARKNSVYCAVCIPDGDSLFMAEKPRFCTAEQCAAIAMGYPNAIIVGSDIGLYPEISSLPNKKIMRISAPGGQISLIGERDHCLSISPAALKGEYLRDPDIGPASDN